MTQNQQRLPKEVAGGRRTFRCASSVLKLLGEFEAVADDLLRPKVLGYVEGCLVRGRWR